MNKLLILLLVFASTDPSEISRYNRLKNKAETAFEHGQYEVAKNNYSMLYDSIGAEDPSIGLNLAHCYYALGDSTNAKLKYQAVVTGDDKKLKSIAYQQLGVMAKKPETLNESLQYLKSALKADPTNEDARYNYEVVKRMLEKQQEQQKDQNQQDQDQDEQNKDDKQDQEKKDQQDKGDQEQKDQEQKDQEQDQDQENQDQESQEKKDGEQKEGEEKEQQQQEGDEQNENKDKKNEEMSTKEKLEKMNISEEKAQMILEAMKNNEIQYIQQQRRKPTKAQDSDKPDW
ncbi:MAG: hypothetical protein RIC35_15020 [Marinoscillum sp.]